MVGNEFKDEFALARMRIATDGVALFVELADRSVVDVRRNDFAICAARVLPRGMSAALAEV